MMVNPTLLSLRAKKLGVLIADARLAAGKNVTDCARLIGVPTETFEAYELGQSSPSLPELELLSYSLNVPLEHFWGSRSISKENQTSVEIDYDQFFGLRNKIIGASLRDSRSQIGMSLDDVAERLDVEPSQVEAYEFGEFPLPVPMLESLCDLYNVSVKDYFDKNGPVGQWVNQQHNLEYFLQLPSDLQEFVIKPVNMPYLELAQKLSDMSVDKLRAVAEVLLEITL